MPANIAQIRVTLGDTDLTDRIAPRLLSLRLTEKRAGEADELELDLHNHDGRLAVPKTGALLRVALGWRRGADVIVGLVDKGSFTVDEVTLQGPPDVITVRARSADLTAGYRVAKDAAFHDTTLGEVVRKVASAHGLKANVAESLAGIAVPVLGQSARSDMALVRHLGRRYDAVATVKAGTLVFAPIGAGKNANGHPLASATIDRRDGDGYRFSEVKRDAYDGVSAQWHDQDAAARKTATTGGASGTHKRLRRTFATEADAKAASNAEWQRIRRGMAEADLTLALGRPDLSPERRVTLTGYPAAMASRKWLIAEATHAVDGAGGLQTSIKLETA